MPHIGVFRYDAPSIGTSQVIWSWQLDREHKQGCANYDYGELASTSTVLIVFLQFLIILKLRRRDETHLPVFRPSQFRRDFRYEYGVSANTDLVSVVKE